MKMTAERRAIDKLFRRRDRYDIPDWQREEVWDDDKKQRLVDSILRGWKLPKFYFVKTSEDDYLVEDGQQRLAAIFDFFSDELSLDSESARRFGGRKYSELSRPVADSFDDFEIEFDVIEDATDEELKEFFQRLQGGMPLTSSEKLNAVHSKLRDFCRSAAKHSFFKDTVSIPNTRYAHFDIVAKVVTVELEGLDTGLRLDDVKLVFQAQKGFANTSAVAKRIRGALDLLNEAFKDKGSSLRTRTIVQSLITLTCKLVATGRSAGAESKLHAFFETFMAELALQVDKGQDATDSDYVTFQKSVSANVKGGGRIRQEVLLRKLFTIAPDLAGIFDPSVIAESGVSGRLAVLAESVAQLISQLNRKHAATTGEDLFKATNKTAQALVRLRKPVTNRDSYGTFVDDLYFLFREAAGSRLDGANLPLSFVHVNELRTDLRHDVDHGEKSKVRAKRRKSGTTFSTYAGDGTPDTIEPARFPLFQANLLAAIEGDLRGLFLKQSVSAGTP